MDLRAFDSRGGSAMTGNQNNDATEWTQHIYNRPAIVTKIYSDTARVRWQDTGTLGFVPLDALAET